MKYRTEIDSLVVEVDSTARVVSFVQGMNCVTIKTGFEVMLIRRALDDMKRAQPVVDGNEGK